MSDPIDQPDTRPRGTPAAWIARWIRRAAVTGFALSLLLHAGFLTASAYIAAGGGGPGTGTAGGVATSTPVEVAFLNDETLAPAEDAALPISAPEVREVAESLPGLTMDAVVGGQGTADAGDTGAIGSGLGGAGSGEGIGVGEGSGGAGGGTSFFGVEARGTRIAYICDISGSMTGEKLATLKRQLSISLDGLPEGGQFLVIFFESRSLPLGQQERWIDANHKNKEWADLQIRQVEARGGTNPEPAFVSAMALRPRPDAIYFMTDGLFDEAVVGRVAVLQASGKRVPVHAIAVGERGSEALMRRIADGSGGSYTFVDGGP